MKKLLIVFLGFLLWNCGSRGEECVFIPDVSPEEIELDFHSYEDTLVNMDSKQQFVKFLSRQPVIRDEMLSRASYPDDSVFINEMFQRFTNPAIDTLLLETRAVFGDGSSLEAEFRQAFANLRYYYPDFVPPKIRTLITGLDTDLFVSDTLILVSLDFFLGPGAKYRPKTYQYLMRRYDPDDIVPSCLLIYGIDPRLNKTDLGDRTVLAEMIAYGKSFYFAKHMMPCLPDSSLIWYTREETEGAEKNQDLIWARLIEDQILFSTRAIDKKNFLSDRPATTQVGEKCPGRIGQWVGWQIVKAYMERNPETSLPELMRIDDARSIFQKANYKPQMR